MAEEEKNGIWVAEMICDYYEWGHIEVPKKLDQIGTIFRIGKKKSEPRGIKEVGDVVAGGLGPRGGRCWQRCGGGDIDANGGVDLMVTTVGGGFQVATRRNNSRSGVPRLKRTVTKLAVAPIDFPTFCGKMKPMSGHIELPAAKVAKNCRTGKFCSSCRNKLRRPRAQDWEWKRSPCLASYVESEDYRIGTPKVKEQSRESLGAAFKLKS
uniref:Uncharacterized protein n=1 Tax=Oryza nivara TaxID=4536 RepID=A0A0E0IQJ2_ORYNI